MDEEDSQCPPSSPRGSHSDNLSPKPKEMQSKESQQIMDMQDQLGQHRSSSSVDPTIDITPAFSQFMQQCWRQWSKTTATQGEPSVEDGPSQTKRSKLSPRPSFPSPGLTADHGEHTELGLHQHAHSIQSARARNFLGSTSTQPRSSKKALRSARIIQPARNTQKSTSLNFNTTLGLTSHHSQAGCVAHSVDFPVTVETRPRLACSTPGKAWSSEEILTKRPRPSTGSRPGGSVPLPDKAPLSSSSQALRARAMHTCAHAHNSTVQHGHHFKLPSSRADISPPAFYFGDKEPSECTSTASSNDNESEFRDRSDASKRTFSWVQGQAAVMAEPSASHSQEPPSDNGEGSKKVEPVLQTLLQKAKEIFPRQVKSKDSGSNDKSQGDWASITSTKRLEPTLSFARSGLVEDKIDRQFARQTADRCSQTRPSKGVPIKPPKCRIAKYNFDDGRPLTYAEPNLTQVLLGRTPHKKESSSSDKKLRTYEEIARRTLTAASQLDALKNLALVSMTQDAPDGQDREWAESADPNLLRQILEAQHNTIDYVADLAAFLLADTVMDRRQATLSRSSILPEVQRSLLQSDPRKKGLWDEERMEKAKKDLESEALTRPWRRPAAGFSNPRHPQGSNSRQDTWQSRSTDAFKGRSTAIPNQSSPPKQPQRQFFGASTTSFGPSTPQGSFRKGNFRKAGGQGKRK